MKIQIARATATLLMVLLSLQLVWATCGGGGGGGGGGMPGGAGGSGGASNPEVYFVPWKIRKPNDSPPIDRKSVV